jgi:iron complex outermembrane recepter protein
MSHTVRKAWAFALCALALSRDPARAANLDQLAELKRMSVEELLNVEVTSVSRREEGLRNAAAAVAVITHADLRRSGATHMPDALRLVPGLHVGRQNSSSWAVSARGFSSVNSEKLLVLSDTRSIYTPLFAGVLWDVQDYLLEDVERVEVVRGPGAALWGSNAVNGVISITTRSARDTHGSYLEAGAGELDRLWLGARLGGETGGGKHYRVFGRYVDRDATRSTASGSDDAWQMAHVGFRSDWGAADSGEWTVQGDAYAGDIGQLSPSARIGNRAGPPEPLEVDVSGGNLLARWRRQTGESSDLQLRGYYDYTRRDDPSFDDTLHTLDVDLQHRLRPRANHELTWGAAVRATSNRNRRGVIFAMDPEESDDLLWSGFIQDQIAFSQSVAVTLGTKLEHNDFSGFEVQPSVRAAWSLSSQQTLWASVSRAVRVPTRLERDVFIDATDPAGNPVVRLLGNPDFDAETLIAYETGYRWQATRSLAFDVALFYNDYDKLASLEFGAPFVDGTGRTIYPIYNQNLTSGRSAGAEVLAEWQPVDFWRLSGSYSYVDLELDSDGQDANNGVWLDGATPRGQVALRSWLGLGAFAIDAQFRHHTRIRRLPVDPSGAGIDAYSSLDLRLGWRLAPAWEVSLVGQNLLDDEHVEFGTPDLRSAMERSAYLKVEWRRE